MARFIDTSEGKKENKAAGREKHWLPKWSMAK